MKERKPARKPSGGAEKIIIEIMNGPEDGRVVRCDRMPVSIGRADDNVVSLSYDHLVSRHHAQIVKAEDVFVIHDLNSANGIYVGSKRIREKTALMPKKLFRIGATQLAVKVR